jgi:acetyltransferase-like isoleucine patch superfamily enzyme
MNRIYENVKFGENCKIGDNVIIGEPPAMAKPGELETIIGNNAVIRSHTIIYAGNEIGDNFRTGHHVMIRENNIIGNDCSIGTGSILEHSIKLYDGVRIHSQAFIPEFTILKSKAWIGPNVVITNAPHPTAPQAKEYLQGVIVEEYARVGANSTILPGVTIGKNALVGAGSVVTRDIPEDSVSVGNPAKVIKKIQELEYPFETEETPYD